jgi:acyl-coenzyme A synthetase/AMP-(fatty) acid ligase/thioesterase domain-containing protein/acyl carrier protein
MDDNARFADPAQDRAALTSSRTADQAATTLVLEIERQSALHPSSLAVTDGSRSLTYSELNRAANRLAHAILARRGPGAEPVGILLPHNADAVVAVVAVLKAGKIRLSLDSQAPPARHREVLGQAGVSFVVTEKALVSALGETPSDDTLTIDDMPLGLSEENPDLDIPPDAPACIYYTSGSTGRPKGVVTSHRVEVARLLDPDQPWREMIRSEFRVPVLFDLSFGGSGVPGMLILGCSIHMKDYRAHGSAGLAEWLRTERINMIGLPPALLQALVAELAEGLNLPDLRAVALTFDRHFGDDVEALRRLVPRDCRFTHLLGGSEAGLVASSELLPEETLGAGALPTGTPPSFVRVAIDDPGPNGIGEIVIASPHVALGYWNEPGLTATKFGVDPEDPSLRTFRTGDLGRFRPDGTLEFHGREDSRVKIRGYPVDLIEVDRALMAMDGVHRAVSVVDRRDERRPRLVAYIVPGVATERPTASALRRAVLDLLPPYQVPATFVFLESLPRTARGKLDIGGLPPPPRDRPHLDTAFIAPRDELERSIARVWSQVLAIDDVGIHDDFHELGGDSLAEAEVSVALTDVLRREIPFTLFLEGQTVAEMATALRKGTSSVFSEVVPLQPAGSLPPLFLVPGGGGEVLELAPLASSLAPDQPCYGFQVIGAEARRAYERVDRLAARYSEMVLQETSGRPYFLAGYSFGVLVAFEMACQLAEAGVPPLGLVLLDLEAPRVGGMDRAKVKRPLRLRTLVRRGMLRLLIRAGRPIPARWREINGMEAAGRAIRSYSPRRYPGGVVLFRSEAHAADTPGDLGWGALVDGPIAVTEVPGSHRGMIQPPNMEIVGAALGDVLRGLSGIPAGASLPSLSSS